MKKIAFVFVLLLATLTTSAQKTVTPQLQEKIIAEINATAKGITSLQCDFVQTKTLSIMDERMVSKGKMVFARPNRFRWQYTSPYDYTFIITDDKVHIAKGNNKNSIDLKSSQVFQEIARMIAGSVTGRSLTEKKDFDVQIQTTNDTYIALLKPKKSQMRKMFKQIRLTFNKKERIVTQVEMTDANGDVTVIQMQHVVQNEKVDSKAFVLDQLAVVFP